MTELGSAGGPGAPAPGPGFCGLLAPELHTAHELLPMPMRGPSPLVPHYYCIIVVVGLPLCSVVLRRAVEEHRELTCQRCLRPGACARATHQIYTIMCFRVSQVSLTVRSAASVRVWQLCHIVSVLQAWPPAKKGAHH